MSRARAFDGMKRQRDHERDGTVIRCSCRTGDPAGCPVPHGVWLAELARGRVTRSARESDTPRSTG